MNIALKEARETRYWLELLQITGYLPENQFKKTIDECAIVERILTKIIKTTKENLEKNL